MCIFKVFFVFMSKIYLYFTNISIKDNNTKKLTYLTPKYYEYIAF